MKNTFLKTLIVAAMLAVASIAFTQDSGPGTGAPGQQGPGGGRQQGGGRGQQGGQRQGMGGQRMQQAGFTNPLAGSGFSTLDRADVQADLKVTPEQKTAITALREKYATSMRDAMMAARQNGGDQAAMQAARERVDVAMTPEINNILDKTQQDRFKQIRIQIAGLRAVLSPEIQSALNMPGEQRTKINVLARNATMAQQALRQQVMNQQISMEDVQGKNKEISDKFDADLAALVTPEQKEALKALGGVEFKAAPGGNRQGGAGNGGGRPGGRPGGNGGGGTATPQI